MDCHPSSSSPSVDSILDDFESSFPGVDYSLLKESKDSSSDSFLSWVAQRDERIIVGKWSVLLLSIQFFFFVLFLEKTNIVFLSCHKLNSI